jgi:hypothetical protein
VDHQERRRKRKKKKKKRKKRGRKKRREKLSFFGPKRLLEKWSRHPDKNSS